MTGSFADDSRGLIILHMGKPACSLLFIYRLGENHQSTLKAKTRVTSMRGLSTISIRLIVILLMITGLAALSTITNYSAVFLFNYFNLVGTVFEPIAKMSLGLTGFLLFIDALVLMLALLLFRRKSAS